MRAKEIYFEFFQSVVGKCKVQFADITARKLDLEIDKQWGFGFICWQEQGAYIIENGSLRSKFRFFFARIIFAGEISGWGRYTKHRGRIIIFDVQKSRSFTRRCYSDDLELSFID